MCWQRLRSLDADEVLSYQTLKTVIVKDRYLGGLRLIMLLAIFGYVVGYVVIYNKGYRVLDNCVGTVATSLMMNKSVPVVPAYTPYCAESNSSGVLVDPLPCVVWDAEQVRYPPDALDSLFVTTRTTITYEMNDCPNSTYGCPNNTPWVNISAPESYYCSGIESFTVRITHSMQAPKLFRETGSLDYAGDSDSMSGVLVGQDGEVLSTYGDEIMDIVPVWLLLQAAGTDLNHPMTIDESQRHSGILLLCYITYDGDGFSRPTYTYSVSQIPKAEYKIVEPVSINETVRMTVDRHGIKVVFIISGQLSRPDFQTALIQLVSALGLLSVATIVVDFLMVYVMPNSKLYTRYKYEETVDFSDVRDALEAGADPATINDDDSFRLRLQSDLGQMRTSTHLRTSFAAQNNYSSMDDSKD